MRIISVNNQFYARKNLNNQNFQGKGKKVGGVIGGLTGLLVCGAAMSSFNDNSRTVKGWPLMLAPVAIGCTMQGAMMGKICDDAKNEEKKES